MNIPESCDCFRDQIVLRSVKPIGNEKSVSHYDAIFFNYIEFRFWVEFLIDQFILGVTFSFDWDIRG